MSEPCADFVERCGEIIAVFERMRGLPRGKDFAREIELIIEIEIDKESNREGEFRNGKGKDKL